MREGMRLKELTSSPGQLEELANSVQQIPGVWGMWQGRQKTAPCSCCSQLCAAEPAELRSPCSGRGNGHAGKPSHVLGSAATGQQEPPEHPNALSLPHAWRLLRVWFSHKLASAGSLRNILARIGSHTKSDTRGASNYFIFQPQSSSARLDERWGCP